MLSLPLDFINMRNLYILLCVLAISLVSGQTSINFEKSDFSTILEKAEKENKLVFLDAFASWCGPCILMEKNVFTDPEVYTYYNQHFINARIDMEKGEGRELAKKYGVNTYPSYLFLNGKGEVVLRGYGYLKEEQFVRLGQDALIQVGGIELKKRFMEGEEDPEFLKQAFGIFIKSDPLFAKQIAERYFSKFTLKELDKLEVAMLLNSVKSATDSNYAKFISLKQNLLEHIPAEALDKLQRQYQINGAIDSALNMETGKWDKNLFLENTKELLTTKQAKELWQEVGLNFFGLTKNFKEYEALALEVMEEERLLEPQLTTQILYTFAENIENKESFRAALDYGIKVHSGHSTPELSYLIAKLYHKLGNKKLALKYATESVALTEEKGADATIPKKLLKEITQ